MFTEKAGVQKSIPSLAVGGFAFVWQLDMASAQGVHGGVDGD